MWVWFALCSTPKSTSMDLAGWKPSGGSTDASVCWLVCMLVRASLEALLVVVLEAELEVGGTRVFSALAFPPFLARSLNVTRWCWCSEKSCTMYVSPSFVRYPGSPSFGLHFIIAATISPSDPHQRHSASIS